MRTLSFAIAAGLVACSAAPRPGPVHGEVVLSIEGLVENGPFRFGRQDLLLLPLERVRGRPPGSPPAVFAGPSLAVLLAERMQLAEGTDTAIVRSRDGYAVGVPLVVLRQLKPVLADSADGRPLADWGRSTGRESRPLLLAWPNLEWPGFDSDPRARSWWPSNVASIELVRWERTYGRALQVPAGAGDEARLGAEAYSFHCIACHRIRGFGGAKGPELTRSARGRNGTQVLEGFRAHALRTGLPAFAPQAEEALRRIAAFLVAVELSGATPEDLAGADGGRGPVAPNANGGR